MKKIINLIIILITILSSLVITGCMDISNETDKKDETKKELKYGLDEKFTFNNLEITLGKDITFTTVNNEYSDYYKKTIVRLPITVKNLKNESHSLTFLDYKIFGSQGTEVKNASIYFEDSVDSAGELRTGASYTKFMYFTYDGDGTYTIEFDDWFNPDVIAEFEIKK